MLSPRMAGLSPGKSDGGAVALRSAPSQTPGVPLAWLLDFPRFLHLLKDLARRHDVLGDFGQLAVPVARQLSQAAEGSWLLQAGVAHHQSLGPLDQFAVLQRL